MKLLILAIFAFIACEDPPSRRNALRRATIVEAACGGGDSGRCRVRLDNDVRVTVQGLYLVGDEVCLYDLGCLGNSWQYCRD